MSPAKPRLQVVLPAHNEAGTIADCITRLIRVLSEHVRPEVIVSEDGSTDGTLAAVQRAKDTLSVPIAISTKRERRGYSQALVDGLQLANSDYVLVMDPDGQYDPCDFVNLWARREEADVVQGIRRPRNDILHRRFMSATFLMLYRMFLPHPSVPDPSCSFALLRTSVIKPILPQIRRLPFGFWWELVARGDAAGCSFASVAVRHTQRNGKSRAFPIFALPGRVATSVVGLLLLRRDLYRGSSARRPLVRSIHTICTL